MINSKLFVCFTATCLFGIMSQFAPIVEGSLLDDYTDVCDTPASNNKIHGNKTNREICEDVHQFCVAFNVTSKRDDAPFDDDFDQDFRCQQAVKCKNDNDCAGHSYFGSGELKCIKEYKYKWTYFYDTYNIMDWKTSTKGQCGISSRAIFTPGCDQERASSATSSEERRRLAHGTPATLVFNNFADFSAFDCNHVEENSKTIEENCATMGKACMNLSFTQTFAAEVDRDDAEFPGQRHFKSALCEVPLYYCDEYDCESMGYVCGSGNYSRWDDDDWMQHYDRPFCVEELTRKGYVDPEHFFGTNTQTRLAVPLNCEGAPTTTPTIAPTSGTTISVAVQFDITASAAPTNADKTALKESIANATDVTTDEVKNLAVTSTSARRRLGEKNRRLTVYTWSVDCDIVATDLGSTTSADFQTAVAADLSATSFTNNVLAKVPSATGVSSVTTVAATRNPSTAPIPTPTMVPIPTPTMVPIPTPTMVPVLAPTVAPTAIPKKKNDDDADDISTGALAGIIIGSFVGLLLIGAAIFLFMKSRAVKEEDGQVENAATFKANNNL